MAAKIINPSLEDIRRKQIAFNKRKSGIVKKVEQLRRLCGVKVAVFIEDDAGELYSYVSIDDEHFPPSREQREGLPVLRPSDFMTDDEGDGVHLRKKLPNIVLRSSHSNTRRRPTRYTRGSSIRDTKDTPSSDRSLLPPELPDFIKQLAIQHDQVSCTQAGGVS